MRCAWVVLLVLLAPLAAAQLSAPALPIPQAAAPSLPALPAPPAAEDAPIMLAALSAPPLPVAAPTIPALPPLPLAWPALLAPGPDGFPAAPFAPKPPHAPRGSGAGVDAAPVIPSVAAPEQPPPQAGGLPAIVRAPQPSPPAPPLSTTLAVGATALAILAARLYSRFERDEVRRAQPRARLCELLAEHPGATLPELMAWTSMRRGTLVHHLQMLERHRVVTSAHDGLRRRVYLAAQRVEPPTRGPTLAEARVLAALREGGPLTQAELAARLGVTVQAANYHIVRLGARGAVQAHEADGERRWAAP